MNWAAELGPNAASGHGRIVQRLTHRIHGGTARYGPGTSGGVPKLSGGASPQDGAHSMRRAIRGQRKARATGRQGTAIDLDLDEAPRHPARVSTVIS